MAYSGAASASVAARSICRRRGASDLPASFLNAGQSAIGAFRAPQLAKRSQASKIHKDCASVLVAGCNWSKDAAKRRRIAGARGLLESYMPLAIESQN